MKSVQDFAAKTVTVSDSQADWQRWSSKPPSSSSNNKKQKDQEEEEENVASSARHKWSRQVAQDGTVTWLDSVSGQVSTVEPNFVDEEEESDSSSSSSASSASSEEEEEEDDEEEVMEVATSSEQPSASSKPPQVWELLLDSLTRKPVWYCAELKHTRTKPPPNDAGFRAVRDELNPSVVYFVHSATGETRE